MTSIYTNTAAMAASERLSRISSSMDRTQAAVSSGLRVGNASDNAAYWSISTTMKSDGKALSAVSDALAFTSAVLDTAYAGMKTVQQEISAIRNLMIQASQMPVPQVGGPVSDDEEDPVYGQSRQSKITDEINQHFDQIRTAVESASFGGVNLVYKGDDDPAFAKGVTHSFVTGYAAGKVQSTDLALTDTLLINDSWMDDATFGAGTPSAGLFDQGYLVAMKFDSGPDLNFGNSLFNNSSIDVLGNTSTWPIRRNNLVRNIEEIVALYGADRQRTWEGVIQSTDRYAEAVISRMATVGAMISGVDRQSELVKDRIDTVTKGVGRLIDADMNEQSARLKALQTQQQLGIQALSIANAQADNLLRLYQ